MKYFCLDEGTLLKIDDNNKIIQPYIIDNNIIGNIKWVFGTGYYNLIINQKKDIYILSSKYKKLINQNDLGKIVSISCNVNKIGFVNVYGDIWIYDFLEKSTTKKSINYNNYTKGCLSKLNIDISAIKISMGPSYSCCIDDNYNLYYMGKNDFGQAGINPDSIKFFDIFTFIETKVEVIDVCTGYDFTFIKDKNNILYSAGNNRFGQLGQGDLLNLHKFKTVDIVFPVNQISCGDLHIIISDYDGNIYSCGNNYAGQLGLGDFKIRKEFFKILIDTIVTAISCSHYISFFVDVDRSVWVCGCDIMRQKINGCNTSYNKFQIIPDSKVDLIFNHFPLVKNIKKSD